MQFYSFGLRRKNDGRTIRSKKQDQALGQSLKGTTILGREGKRKGKTENWGGGIRIRV